MNKSILITGIAGSGKSAVCDKLKQLGYKAYGIEDIDGMFALVDKKTGRVIKDHNNDSLELVKERDWVCDKDKLQQLMYKNAKGIVFYCGTASNLDDLFPLFDKIFLLKANQEVLRKRLSARASNGFGRTSEVQEWMFSWKKWWEDHVCENGVIIIDVNRNLQKIATDIIGKSKL